MAAKTHHDWGLYAFIAIIFLIIASGFVTCQLIPDHPCDYPNTRPCSEVKKEYSDEEWKRFNDAREGWNF